jgi:hypothetical protein
LVIELISIKIPRSFGGFLFAKENPCRAGDILL